MYGPEAISTINFGNIIIISCYRVTSVAQFASFWSVTIDSPVGIDSLAPNRSPELRSVGGVSLFPAVYNHYMLYIGYIWGPDVATV